MHALLYCVRQALLLAADDFADARNFSRAFLLHRLNVETSRSEEVMQHMPRVV